MALLFALALPKVEVSRMVPVAAGDLTNILQGGYLCFAAFTCVELLFVCHAHDTEIKNIQKIGTNWDLLVLSWWRCSCCERAAYG